MYFLLAVTTAEEILLFIMSYDRYVAICLPLHYHQILSRRNCLLITVGIWAAAVINSLLIVISAMNMSSCHSNVIHQFFCDFKSLTMTTCTGTLMFFMVTSVEILIFVFTPFMCTVISYVNIFSIIFKMTSKDQSKKSFSTCSSHITVVSLYYGAGLIGNLIPSYSDVLDLGFSIIYTNIVPMINPIIYSLQNSNVQTALLGLCYWRKIPAKTAAIASPRGAQEKKEGVPWEETIKVAPEVLTAPSDYCCGRTICPKAENLPLSCNGGNQGKKELDPQEMEEQRGSAIADPGEGMMTKGYPSGEEVILACPRQPEEDCCEFCWQAPSCGHEWYFGWFCPWASSGGCEWSCGF
ncbi:unnamed protein product [Ranitomeya imitator]|uniref:G-protein coupled receptors family 1 profile domain-containing protein n=1 Tax=Ranitomeya imitator TaxID=111125 RepID=A0ABN9MBI5_9NEOB|nr:unnamed protein product [Ranitomeya imitator]